MSKCKGCIFLDTYQDMGASCPVCVREGFDLVAAIKACEAPGLCPWHITRGEVKEAQEKFQADRNTEKEAQEILAKMKDDEKAATELQSALVRLGETAQNCMKPLTEAFEHLARAAVMVGAAEKEKKEGQT